LLCASGALYVLDSRYSSGWSRLRWSRMTDLAGRGRKICWRARASPGPPRALLLHPRHAHGHPPFRHQFATATPRARQLCRGPPPPVPRL